MRLIIAAVLLASVLCESVRGGEERRSIIIEKHRGEDVLRIRGRIKSKHVSFRKGKSVRDYYIVTCDLIKVPLPRSHVEHRNGTISGIYLRKWRGKDVEIICEGRMREDDKKGLVVTVEKIISLVDAKG